MALELKHTGEDVIIPYETIEEEFGLSPGDRLTVHPRVELIPAKKMDEEIKRIAKLMDELTGSWSEEDERLFEEHRRELWSTRRIPDSA